MSTLVLLAPSEFPAEVVGRRVRLRDRLAARWHAGRLDRELARGVAPETDPALSLRAERLIRPSVRRRLARDVGRVVRDARGGHPWLEARIPARLEEVLAAADELESLAGRLAEPGPVSPQGVAQVRVLLTDGCGPLYFKGAAQELRTAIEQAFLGLELQA